MFAASKTASVSGGYQISRSLRFNQPDSTYLNRAFSTNGTSQRICTISLWAKLGSVSTSQYRLVDCYNGSSGTSSNIRVTNNQLILAFGGGSTAELTTSAVYRDPSAWYHIVASIDSTQATSSDRMKLYVNGVQVTAFASSTYPTQNATYNFMFNVGANVIGGAWDGTSSQYLNGYMTEVNFIDGQALTPSSFGETNAQTGVWQPKAYSGSYGTNGFYLNFSDNSNTTAATLGKDYSGNGNNWTPNNFSVTAGAGNDSLVDSPTSYGTDTGVGGTVRGNYCTMNPLKNNSNNVLSNGNLTVVNSASSTSLSFGTIGYPKSDKYYFEALASANAGTTAIQIGIASTNHETTNTGSKRYWYLESGGLYEDGTLIQTVSSFTAGDVIACAYNGDANTVTWYKNNTQQGTAVSVSTSYDYVPLLGIYKGQWDVNFGQRPFAYTAPSGFKALCTQNLPTPTIGTTTATQANLYFTPTLFTGTGSSRVITTGMQSDFIWTKSRSQANDNMFFDVVRGISRAVRSNSTGAESYDAGYYVTSFNSDGYNIGGSDGALNNNGQTYVSWTWKANGTGSTNTAGSITSTVSANTTSGFSIVTYTGTGSAATVGHGLGVAPSMIICKGRSVGGNYWQTQHSALGATKALFLNTTDAAFTNAAYWNNTAPTSTVFSLGGNTDANGNGTTYVAYCFAEIAGYSKFGSYTGNGSADGPFVFTNMRPAFLMIKRTDTAGFPWVIIDATRNPNNALNLELYPNTSGAEGNGGTTYIEDFLSNGFKIRQTDGTWNASGGTYIYMAIAQNPFKYSLAR